MQKNIFLYLFLLVSATTIAQVMKVSIAPIGSEKFVMANYSLWLPDSVKPIRGILIHQHGCGPDAAEAGKTAAFDLQWRALAKKWDFALLGSSYQVNNDNCGDWANPLNGSNRAFVEGIKQLAKQTNHPELNDAPWVIWGHSGGGNWAFEMMMLHQDKVLALAIKSSGLSEVDSIKTNIPIFCIFGERESYDQFSNLWCGAIPQVKALFKRGYPIGFAVNPISSHDCADSRSLFIPYIDEIIKLRLEGNTIKEIDYKDGVFGFLLNFDEIETYQTIKKDYKNQYVWLPDKKFASKWQEFQKTGTIKDSTPPQYAPFKLTDVKSEKSITLKWDALSDIESGIESFLVYRNNKLISEIKGAKHDLSFNNINYSDTPDAPLDEMKFVDNDVSKGKTYNYEIALKNRAGLVSPLSKVCTVKF
ncbi:MAG TPA: hypothetical protein VIK55_07500 [Paludibacter sp.]